MFSFRSLVLLLLLSVSGIASAYTLDTLYGSCEITEPVIIELIQSDGFQRLKHINQYGVNAYIHETVYPYTRYTHSLGVMYLLRVHGASLLEQIAGLLHDASHTVFSHVGDHVGAQMRGWQLDQNADAYQDEKHLWLLSKTDILAVLQKYGYTLEQINHKGDNFAMLEQSLPDICADRLEYNLYGAYIEGWTTPEQVRSIVSHVHYGDDRWYFDELDAARTIAEFSIELCLENFGSIWNFAAYHWAAKALLAAVDAHELTMDDIHFGFDDVIMQRLKESEHEAVAQPLSLMMQAKTLYEPAHENNHDVALSGKFRGVNPWVKTQDGYKRLTELDETFNQRYTKARSLICNEQFYKMRVG